MSFYWQNGFHFNATKDSFAIDPLKSHAGTVLLSHAHSDHAQGLKTASRIFGTSSTRELLFAAEKKVPSNFTPVPVGSRINCGDVTVSLYHSAHILGSVQFLMEGTERVLYSSDIVLDAPPFWSAPEIPACDTLIIESTFGLSKYSFPPREVVFEQMASWAKKCLARNELVVLSGYALGKSQELTWFSNEYLGISPHVAKPIAGFNAVYQQAGVKLGPFDVLNHNTREAQVLVLPPSWVTPPVRIALSADAKRRVTTAVCTGWDFRANGFDQSFPLSDHADFKALIEIVKQSGASRVLTMHGFDDAFAKSVQRECGIPAQALKDVKTSARLF